MAVLRNVILSGKTKPSQVKQYNIVCKEMESEFEDLHLYQRHSNCLLYNSKQIRKQTFEIVLPSVEMGIISPDITTSQIIRVSIAKLWKQSKYPLMDEQVKKMCHICVYVYVFVLCVCVYTPNGMLFTYSKTLPFVT